MTLVRPLYHDFPDEPLAYHYAQAFDAARETGEEKHVVPHYIEETFPDLLPKIEGLPGPFRPRGSDPLDTRAYGAGYFLGADLLVYPIVTQGCRVKKLAWKRMWIPAHWYDLWNGRLEAPAREIVRGYGLDEVPLFQRAGSVIPLAERDYATQSSVGMGLGKFKAIMWQAILPVSLGHDNFADLSGVLYDDDTVSGAGAETVSFSGTFGWPANSSDANHRLDGKAVVVQNLTVLVQQDDLSPSSDHRANRTYRLKLLNVPARFEVLNADVPYTWEDYGLVFPLVEGQSTTIQFRLHTTPSEEDPAQGFRGALHKARRAKLWLDEANVPYGSDSRGALIDACLAGTVLAGAVGGVVAGSGYVDFYRTFWRNLRQGYDEVLKLETKVLMGLAIQRKRAVLGQLREALSLGPAAYQIVGEEEEATSWGVRDSVVAGAKQGQEDVGKTVASMEMLYV